MQPQLNLLDLLDPKKTTSPITSLPKLSTENCRAFSAISKAPTCSTKSSESPENMFLTINNEKQKNKIPKITKQNHSKPRTGDWICLLCGNHNYSFRETCNRCQKQTKTRNLEQSLRIFNNGNLKNDLMKNDSMAKRLEFNFCYSLGPNRPIQKYNNTLNSNIVSDNFPQSIPFSMVNHRQQYQPHSDYYMNHKISSFQNHSNLRPNFMSGYSVNQMQQSNQGFNLHSDFRSKISDFPQVSQISPMFNFNSNQQFQNFKKGTIKSCLLYTSPSPRDGLLSRMPSSA